MLVKVILKNKTHKERETETEKSKKFIIKDFHNDRSRHILTPAECPIKLDTQESQYVIPAHGQSDEDPGKCSTYFTLNQMAGKKLSQLAGS